MRISLSFRALVMGVLVLAAGLAHAPRSSSAPAWEEVAVPLEGEWTAPLPSPDGTLLAFTRIDYRGLYLLDLSAGTARTLTEAPGAGFHSAWSPDGRSLAFRASTGGERPTYSIVVAHPDGVTEVASPLLRALSLPFWRGRHLDFFRLDGPRPRLMGAGPAAEAAEGSTPLPACSPDGLLWRVLDGAEGAPSADGKAFFLPVLSSDGRLFVVQSLDGHLYLGNSEGGALEDLGPGAYPSFVRKDKTLLFERTRDDGHALTAGSIFLLDLASRKAVAVVEEPGLVARRPAMAGDGHTLYFEAGGRIFREWVP